MCIRDSSNIVLDSAVNEEGELDFTTKRGSAIKSLCDLRDAGAIDVIQQWTPQDLSLIHISPWQEDMTKPGLKTR